MRDFRAELADDKCWDEHTQLLFDRTGAPFEDCILQNREELIGLCEFIEAKNIRRYVEIGAWTGRLASVLQRLFDFDLIAVCDLGVAQDLGLPFRLPFGSKYLRQSSHSRAYVDWRLQMGDVDLVMIDGDHTFQGVSTDFEINSQLPHRFLAFHDITGADETTTGVGRFWRGLEGYKREIIEPHRELDLPHSTMGIGIWSASEQP